MSGHHKSFPRGFGKGKWGLQILDGKPVHTFTCPCGILGYLENHAIDARGYVTPSVVCPENCGFHEFIQLEGWGGNASD